MVEFRIQPFYHCDFTVKLYAKKLAGEIKKRPRKASFSAQEQRRNTEQFKFFAIPAKAGIHALTDINELQRAWAPAFAGVARYSAFPLLALTHRSNLSREIRRRLLLNALADDKHLEAIDRRVGRLQHFLNGLLRVLDERLS